MMMQHQSDENQGVDELLLQEYEQFLSHVDMPIEWSMPRSDFDSRIYRQCLTPLLVPTHLNKEASECSIRSSLM
jgi:hypothetical protein